MTSRELLYVKTIADEKSISKAAKKLYLAQPSLSQSIQRLEDTLGTALFNRTPTGLTLTYAGERYYQIANQILRIYEDFEAEISDINNLKTGRINLGITNHLGSIVLPSVLPDFKRSCPLVEVNIMEETSSSLDQKLLSGELDFTIMHTLGDEQHPQIHYELLSQEPFLIVVSKNSHLLDEAVVKDGYPYPVLDLKLLKQEAFLMLHKSQRIRQVTDSLLKKAGISQPHVALTVKNYETVHHLAAEGIGVTLIPADYAKVISSEYQPAFLSIEDKYKASWNMCIAYSRSGFLSKADQFFMDCVRKHFS